MRLKCQKCEKGFSIPLTLEVAAMAQEPHVVLCAECEVESLRRASRPSAGELPNG
jgi:hypothetical protein